VTGAGGTFEQRARRLDRARERVLALAADERAAAEELAGAQDEHFASVLRTIVTRLRADDRGRELLFELVDDPEVHAALVKAQIVRPSVAMRAAQAIEGVRPYIQGHGGDVELLRIEEGVAYVRLTGACQSCSASSITLRQVLTEALLTAVPEIVSVEDDRPAAATGSGLLQISPLVVEQHPAR
jgi:Fe-S cluster biogenesis protein NfuA